MNLTLSQFAETRGITDRAVQRSAQRSGFRYIRTRGQCFGLIEDGAHDTNGRPRYLVVVPDEPVTDRKKVHLGDDQREAALSALHALFAKTTNTADAISRVAKQFGVSYHSIYRLWKNPDRAKRKVRADKGSTKKIIPSDAMEVFSSIYIQNAQRGNVQLAYNLTRRQFPGFTLPFRYFKARAIELEPMRLAHHQASQWEQKYTTRARRDLWAEFEFLDQVTLDGWTVPDRVLKATGLDELTKRKFSFAGKDVSMVCVFAFDSKTREPLAWRAFEKSVTADDVLTILLEVVHNWGVPRSWLLDNGTEFTNEPVQRFIRGLYATDDHEAKNRVIFSEPYQPYGKGSHERQHRIFKDEFVAFSNSYSPNQQESRKPTRQLSYVKPSHTLEQWTIKFQSYLDGYFREAQRVTWLNPSFGHSATENADRPRCLNDAFERAYRTFSPVKCDPKKLAFLYGKRFRSTIKQGTFRSPAAISPRKYIYVPEGEGVPYARYRQTFEIVVNPTNLFQAWICDLDGNTICEAWDLRGKNNSGVEIPTKQLATELRKARNQELKHAKKAAEAHAARVKMEEVMAGKSTRAAKPAAESIEQSLYTTMPTEPSILDTEVDEDLMKVMVDAYTQSSSEDAQ